MTTSKLEYLLRPRSVAIIGASQKAGAIGNTAVKNFADLDFKGKVYGVNPKYEEVEGFPCFPTATDIPDNVDVAIIAVPGHIVENAIKECAEKKISFVVIFSAGFAEIGEEGLKKQNEILRLCKENGIRIIGPNTMGLFNILDKVNLSFSGSDTSKWLPGNIGLVSQSGATGGTILNKTEEEKIGFSYMVTTGNQIDLNTLDIVEEYIEDDNTKIIASYMEAVPSGEKLKEFARRALNKHKPFLVYKSGRSEAGQKAALSHTASLTGSNVAFELVAKQYGVTTVDSIEEMIDSLKAFNGNKYPKGNRVATVVISGATGIMIADNLADHNHRLVELSERTKEKLREVVPDYLSVENPVDIASTLLTNAPLFKHCVETLAEAEEVDSIIVHLPIGKGMGGEKFAEDLVAVSNQTDKPIITIASGTEGMMSDIRKYLNENRVPAYSDVNSATKVLNTLLEYENMYNERRESAPYTRDTSLENQLQLATSQSSITEPEVKDLLNKSNIPVPNGAVAQNLDELLKKAKNVAYPMVAKIVSPDITHKSDVDGVVLPIKNEDELIKAYNSIMGNVQKEEPAAIIDGILIEELVEGPFLETIVGIKRDPIFGPIIMCGLGGVYVEIMQDVAQRLAPITKQDASEMIQELKSYPLFNGFRNGAVYDVDAFASVLAEISNLALNLGDKWEEIEINPLIVREEGKGVMALDGLITLSSTKETVHQ